MIHSAINLLFSPGQVFEVRSILEDGIMASGYFNDPKEATAKVSALNDGDKTVGIYVTLNEVKPALLARRSNRIKTRLSKKDATTADTDIIQRNWLPIDIDPVRPSGVSSSDEEHNAALIKADFIRQYLKDLHWPDPILADSGNGAHLLYRIELPNDSESNDLIKQCLVTLDVIFSDDRCNVDTANFNAARIWKLYGTTSRKGDNIPDRPHRRAAVIEAPPVIGIVGKDLLEKLASFLPPEPEPAAKKKTTKAGQPIDLREWLQTHGLSVEEKPYQGGSLFLFDECPFSSAHKDGAYAIQFTSGAIFAGCHHDSCGSGSQRWSDLREAYEGKKTRTGTIDDRYKAHKEKISKLRTENNSESGRSSRVASVIPVAPEAIRAEAGKILADGDPLNYLLDTFAEEHIGDRVIAHCFAMSFASRQVINCNGLHVSITGESGKGKSHVMKRFLSLIPDRQRMARRMSEKALFYLDDLQPGSAIALDDQALSDQMQEILKGVTTSFKEPFEYSTVNKDRQGQICTIPERCVWWVSKVEGIGDDQVWNRMLSCWIDDTPEQDAKVLAKTLDDAKSIPTSRPKVSTTVLICREIWENLPPVHVVIPYSDRIFFSDSRNRRNADMLLDLVKSHATLFQHQRERFDAGGMACIYANEADFQYAASLFSTLADDGGQITKLTKTESLIVDAIRNLGKKEFTTFDLQQITGKSHTIIWRAMNGSNSHGKLYSGLLEKCPAVATHDRSVQTGDEVEKTTRRMNVYLWDERLYQIWSGSGVVWLSGDDDSESRNHGRSRKVTETFRDAKNEESISFFENTNNNNNNILSHGKSESIECSISPVACASSSSYDLPVSVTHPYPPEDSSSFNERPPNMIADRFRDSADNYEKNRDSGFSALQNPQNPKKVPDLVAGAETDHVNQREVFVVNPGEFKPIDTIVGQGPCERCGSRSIHYIEKLTEERKKTKAVAKRICKKCYLQAQKKKSKTFTTLPGVLNVGQMEKRNNLGRCQVCNAQPGSWYDPVNHISICESCYSSANGPGEHTSQEELL